MLVVADLWKSTARQQHRPSQHDWIDALLCLFAGLLCVYGQQNSAPQAVFNCRIGAARQPRIRYLRNGWGDGQANYRYIYFSHIYKYTKIYNSKLWSGFICCAVTVLFFAAPLTMLFHVIKVKNSESLPFPLIASTFFVSLQWLIYGVLIDDAFVQVNW